MLERVVNPQQGKVTFGYDALGRRVYKEVKHTRTNWLWDGNVPLHEWQTTEKEPLIDIVTWVFEEGTFVPAARVTDKGSQSILTDYLGTPVEMYGANGEKTWEAQLDIYGRVRTFVGSSLSDCPFRYQGQYQDSETGLYYNRFRYYDPNTGVYLSQDPIGLAGGNPTPYGCVKNCNIQVDLYGLDVYELVAASDGWYPVYEKGQLNPTSYERLNKGDVYKIGESQNPTSRYSQTRLDEARINNSKATSVAIDAKGKPVLDTNGNIVTAGLRMDVDPNTIGNTKQVDRSIETRKIKDYEQKKGHLPAGNKTHH
jgi:RHS repeat-associated protein